MTTDIKTLTTSEAAERVGITGQYMRFLLSKGKGPKGTREGKGGRGGGYRFESDAVDAWDAARVKRAPKGSKKGLTQAQHDAATAMDPAKLERLEAAGWKAGSAEDFLGTVEGTDFAVLRNPDLEAVTDAVLSMSAGMGLGIPAEALLGVAPKATNDE